MYDLAIVIVSWNTKDITRACLESVYGQTRGIAYEVIVVDNASEDGSVEMIRAQFPQVTLIANDANVGFAAANNIGFRHCRARFILLLNSDTIVLDEALQNTVAYAERHPEAGVVSCRILNSDGSIQPNCSMYPSLLNALLFVLGLYRVFPQSRFFGRADMTWWDYGGERDVEVIKGCFMLVRADALSMVGDMDERFFMYSEEVDWCYRFARAGWKLRYFPGADTIHLGGASAARLGGKRALIKDRSSIRYMRKHWSKPALLAGYLMMLLFYVSRLPAVIVLSLLTRSEKYSKIVDNHWSGLRGLLAWKDH